MILPLLVLLRVAEGKVTDARNASLPNNGRAGLRPALTFSRPARGMILPLAVLLLRAAEGKVTDARSASLPNQGRAGLPPGPDLFPIRRGE